MSVVVVAVVLVVWGDCVAGVVGGADWRLRCCELLLLLLLRWFLSWLLYRCCWLCGLLG